MDGTNFVEVRVASDPGIFIAFPSGNNAFDQGELLAMATSEDSGTQDGAAASAIVSGTAMNITPISVTTFAPTLDTSMLIQLQASAWAVATPIGEVPLEGDFDGDGDVDSEDLPLWESGYSAELGAMPSMGDADSDGDVDGLDFLVWQANYGMTQQLMSAAVVPEPQTLSYFGILISMNLLYRGSSRRSQRS